MLAIAVDQSTHLLPDTPPSRASSAPTLICGVPGIMCTAENPVGAGLLANPVDQSTHLLPDTPLSRAGSLPHLYAVYPGFCVQRRTLWERACSRRGGVRQHLCWMTHRFREQAHSHIDCIPNGRQELVIRLCRQSSTSFAPPRSLVPTSRLKPCKLTIAATIDSPNPNPLCGCPPSVR